MLQRFGEEELRRENEVIVSVDLKLHLHHAKIKLVAGFQTESFLPLILNGEKSSGL